MKAKIFSIVSLCASVVFYAQNTEYQEKQIKAYTKKIDSIVMAEKQLMMKEIQLLEQKKLSKEEYRAEKQKIAGRFGKIINEKISAEINFLNEITREKVNQALKKGVDSTSNCNSEDANKVELRFGGRKHYYNPKVENDKKYFPKSLYSSGVVVNYSFLNLTQNAQSFNPFDNNSMMRIGNSHSVEIWARKNKQLGSRMSPVFIHYGIAYRSDTYMSKKPYIFAENGDNIELQEFQEGRLKRSKFRNTYFTLPVEFSWVLNPQYKTDEKYGTYLKPNKNEFRIGVGAYAGVNLRSIIKVKYYDENNNFEKYKNITDNGVNSFLFGGKVSASYGGLVLFLKKDFTPIFNSNTNMPAKNAVHLGIELNNLIFK